MVREQKVEEKVNDYLSGFKSENISPVDDDDAIDQYLLERAAQQLRAASERLRKLERAIDWP